MNLVWMAILPAFIRKRLEGRENLQVILYNTSWLFADKIIRMGVGLFVGVWVARYLGPEQFGILNYVISLVALLSFFATLGLDRIVIRELINYPEKKQDILGSTLMLKLIGGTCTLLFSIVTVGLFRKGESILVLLVLIIAVGTVFQALDTFDYWFQSQVKSKYTVLSKNTAFLLFSAIKILLILNNAPLVAFAFAISGEIAIGSLLLAFAYSKAYESILELKIKFRLCLSLLSKAWPLLLSSLSVLVYLKIDQVMLGQMVNDKSVGMYSAAAQISEICYFIPVVIVSSVSPAFIESRKKTQEFDYIKLQQLFLIMSALAFSVALPMTFLSKQLVVFLYGGNYASAGIILAIHIWAAVFVFLGVAQSLWDVTENHIKLSMMRTIAGAVINIFLNYFLIPQYGGVGAAIATVISYAFSSYILNIVSKKSRAIFMCQTKSLIFLKHFQR